MKKPWPSTTSWTASSTAVKPAGSGRPNWPRTNPRPLTTPLSCSSARQPGRNKKKHLQAQKDQKAAELAAAQKALALTQTLFGQAEAKAEAAAKALQERVDANSKRSRDAFMLRRDSEDLRRRLEENEAACQQALKQWEDKKQTLTAAEARHEEAQAQQEACQKKAAAFEKQAASLRQTAQEKGQRLKKEKTNTAACAAMSTPPPSACASSRAWNRNMKAWDGRSKSS